MSSLEVGDFIVFFASFLPTGDYRDRLAYCLFGFFEILEKSLVGELTPERRAICAHGRRKNAVNDLVVWADPEASGRFPRAVPIGEYRSRAYRVRRELLEQWGGLSVRDGYIQRSAIPPHFARPDKFLRWLEARVPQSALIHQN
jgi:hypothetical protein